MEHYLYKITNTINSKYYIGIHSTNNINDGYMGSGILLKKDIKDFGIQYFKKEILYFAESRSELLEKEKEVICINTLSDNLCYNLVFGGGGVKTISEKRKLFSIPVKRKNTETIRLNKDIYYSFNVKANFEFDEKYVILHKMSPKYLIPVVNIGYNNYKTHKETVNFLKILDTKLGYKDNIFCIETTWKEN